MATLNATPDSFSDGGVNNTIPTAVEYALNALKDGAHIIDVGGYSTRPGAADVSPEEETTRVVTTIQALRAAGVEAPISVDTFRTAVAKAAVEAGANCINDVRALREDGFPAVAKQLGVPVIMMHSRGEDVRLDKHYDGGVMTGVRRELGQQVRGALEAGVRRWNIIADPGIGFSKTVAGNLEMIRNLSQFTSSSALDGPGVGISSNRLSAHINFHLSSDPLASLPVLVGTSRKSYLGTLIGETSLPATERDDATLAACVASIHQGCDILRVHDVKRCRDAALVADALYRHE